MGTASIFQAPTFWVSPLRMILASVPSWHGVGGEDYRTGFLQSRDDLRGHVIAMNVSDQDQVGFGAAIESPLGGIDVDRLAPGLDQKAGVLDGGDLHRSGAGGDVVGQKWRCERGIRR